MSAPTRLYVVTGSAPGTPVDDAVWTDTSGSTRQMLMSRSKAAYDPGNPYMNLNLLHNGDKWRGMQNFYELVNGHDFTGETVKGCFNFYYNYGADPSSNGYLFLALVIRVLYETEPGVWALRGTLLPYSKDDVAGTHSTSYYSRVHPAASTALASVVAQPGDWLVIEWGGEMDCATPTEGTIALRSQIVGGADNTFQDAVTSGDGWIEFSGDLDVGPGQTLRPDNVESNPGAWTGVPDNTDLETNINEVTADDADYIESPDLTGTPSMIRLTLSDGQIPEARDAHKVKVRMRKDVAGGDTANGTVRLVEYVGGSWNNVRKTQTFNNVSETWTTQEITLTNGEASAIQNYANLALEFEGVKA